jgi:hypothetical protein
MPNFTGDNLEIQINPELNEGEKLHVSVVHDETVFQANDGLEAGWMPNGENPLRKKGHGRSLHVSDFLTDTIGRLKLNSEQIDEVGETFPHEARIIMKPGKNYDGYWNADKLIDQVLIFGRIFAQ